MATRTRLKASYRFKEMLQYFRDTHQMRGDSTIDAKAQLQRALDIFYETDPTVKQLNALEDVFSAMIQCLRDN